MLSPNPVPFVVDTPLGPVTLPASAAPWLSLLRHSRPAAVVADQLAAIVLAYGPHRHAPACEALDPFSTVHLRALIGLAEPDASGAVLRIARATQRVAPDAAELEYLLWQLQHWGIIEREPEEGEQYDIRPLPADYPVATGLEHHATRPRSRFSWRVRVVSSTDEWRRLVALLCSRARDPEWLGTMDRDQLRELWLHAAVAECRAMLRLALKLPTAQLLNYAPEVLPALLAEASMKEAFSVCWWAGKTASHSPGSPHRRGLLALDLIAERVTEIRDGGIPLTPIRHAGTAGSSLLTRTIFETVFGETEPLTVTPLQLERLVGRMAALTSVPA